MKVQNSNLLMTVAAIDLNETEMEAIVGGVVLTAAQLSGNISQGVNFLSSKNFRGAIDLLNRTFTGLLPGELSNQQIEVNKVVQGLNASQKRFLKTTFLQIQNESALNNLNTNVKTLLVEASKLL